MTVNRRPDATQYDIIVVGGGISGLAAATWILSRKPQIRVLVVEAGASHRETDRHLRLNRASEKLCAGLFHEFSELCGEYTDIEKHTLCYPNGTELCTPMRPFRMVPREILHRLFRQTLAGLECDIFDNSRVNGLLRHREQIVGVKVDPLGSMPINIRSRLVIGADGPRSRVRKETEPSMTPRLRRGVQQYVRSSRKLECAYTFLDVDASGYFSIVPYSHRNEPWAEIGWRCFGDRQVEPHSRFRYWLGDPRVRMLIDVSKCTGRPRNHTTNVAPLSRFDKPARMRPVAGPGYALVGEATGLAHPLTGEGLELALQTAALIGELIDTHGPMGFIDETYTRQVIGYIRTAYDLPNSKRLFSRPCLMPAFLRPTYLQILKLFYKRSGHFAPMRPQKAS